MSRPLMQQRPARPLARPRRNAWAPPAAAAAGRRRKYEGEGAWPEPPAAFIEQQGKWPRRSQPRRGQRG